MLTGRAKIDFEAWLNATYGEHVIVSTYYSGDFHLAEYYDNLPLSLQQALIIEWFDSISIDISISKRRLQGDYFWEAETLNKRETGIVINRPEANIEAIKFCDEIYNKKHSQKKSKRMNIIHEIDAEIGQCHSNGLYPNELNELRMGFKAHDLLTHQLAGIYGKPPGDLSLTEYKGIKVVRDNQYDFDMWTLKEI